MRRAEARGLVTLSPAEALECFTAVEGWGSFVDGFARALEVGPSWPLEGSEVTWESTPGGRGRVREQVTAYEAPPLPDVAPQSRPGRFATRVEDQSLTGTQTVKFAVHERGTRLELELDYELRKGGILSGVTDALFIRRALRDSLRRTVERFAAESETGGGVSR